jgi:hypothetical protein
MTTHTPHKFRTIYADPDDVISLIVRDAEKPQSVEVPARLIAQAPAMLAALKGLLRYYEPDEHIGACGQAGCHIDVARAILLAVEG